MSNSILFFLVVLQAIVIVWLASKLKQYQKLDRLLEQRFPEAMDSPTSQANSPVSELTSESAAASSANLPASGEPLEAATVTDADDIQLEEAEENIEEAKLVQQVMARCRYAEFYLEQLDDDYERGQFRLIVDDCVASARNILDPFFRDNALHPIILLLHRADWNNYRDSLILEVQDDYVKNKIEQELSSIDA